MFWAYGHGHNSSPCLPQVIQMGSELCSPQLGPRMRSLPFNCFCARARGNRAKTSSETGCIWAFSILFYCLPFWKLWPLPSKEGCFLIITWDFAWTHLLFKVVFPFQLTCQVIIFISIVNSDGDCRWSGGNWQLGKGFIDGIARWCFWWRLWI